MSRPGLLSRMAGLAQFVAAGGGIESGTAHPMTLTVERDGVVVTVTRPLGLRPVAASGAGGPLAESCACGAVPASTKPWRTRGGRVVEASELVAAIRGGWPGAKALCDKGAFDTHTTALAAWLKECVATGLLVRDGKGYALGPMAFAGGAA